MTQIPCLLFAMFLIQGKKLKKKATASVMVLISLLCIFSLLASRIYLFISPNLTIDANIFLIFLLCSWLITDNVIFAVDLRRCMQENELLKSKNDILEEDLILERGNAKNANKWISLAALLQNDTNSERILFRIIKKMRKEVEICEKQKEKLKEYLTRENEEHMETAKVLDRTMHLNECLTQSLYKEKQKRMFIREHKEERSANFSKDLTIKMERMRWKVMADKARTNYYVRRIIFFAECSQSYQQKISIIENEDIKYELARIIASSPRITKHPSFSKMQEKIHWHSFEVDRGGKNVLKRIGGSFHDFSNVIE
jgi:hypothetical protein